MRTRLSLLFLVAALIGHAQPAQPEPEKTPAATAEAIAAVRAELEVMLQTDQAHRKELSGLGRKHGDNSPEVKEAWAKQNAIDAQNIRRLEEIIAQHGWPGSTQFGPQAANAAFLVLQHSDLSYQMKYLDLVREAAVKGELRGSSLALLEDRVRLREGKKQLYGSQLTKNAAGEYEPLPIEDEKNVDQLRARIGLLPLAVYLKTFADWSGDRVNPKWTQAPEKAPSP